MSFNPRPDGVWLAIRPDWGGGIAPPPPPEISQTTGTISIFQTPFDSPGRELSEQRKPFDFEVTNDRSGQSQYFRLFGLDELGEQNIDVKHKQS